MDFTADENIIYMGPVFEIFAGTDARFFGNLFRKTDTKRKFYSTLFALAADFWISEKILTSFNYEYKYTRPGYILVMELIDEIERLGETEYNWYGHETLYKRQWCNKKTPLWQFFIINRTLGGHCYSALSSARRAIKSNKYARDVILKIKNANLGEKQIVR